MKVAAGLVAGDRSWRWSARALGIAAVMALGLLILNDGTSNVLIGRDPRTGRVMGCYTALELLVGATHPTLWGRPVEWLAGLGLVLGASIRGVRLARQMRAALRSTGVCEMLLALMVLALGAPVDGGALRVQASLTGYNVLWPASRCCAFAVEILPHGQCKVTVQGKSGPRVVRSWPSFGQLASLRTALQEQAFFSLPESVGSIPVDGDQHSMTISLGKQKHTVRLYDWPGDWADADYLPKAELEQTRRAFAVWSILRSLVTDPEATVQ